MGGTNATAIARKMIAEDARWMVDSLLSAEATKVYQIPVFLAGHSARIVYEGSEFLRSHTPGVADVTLAGPLPTRHEDVIKRARHAIKLLDNTKKTYTELVQEMGAYVAAHHAEFLDNVRFRWARPFQKDLGLFLVAGRVLGATPTMPFRFGEPSTTPIASLGPLVKSVFESQGRVMCILAEAAGQRFTPAATLSYIPLGAVVSQDWKATKYLPTRFDPSYPDGLKLLLLHVEGDLNTCRYVLPATATGHEDPVFRATVISLYHGLRVLQEADEQHPSAQSSYIARLRALLAAPETQRLLSDHGRHVRNRCMHYEIRGSTAGSAHLASTIPMNGMVEAVPYGRPFNDYQTDLQMVLEEASELLHAWTT